MIYFYETDTKQDSIPGHYFVGEHVKPPICDHHYIITWLKLKKDVRLGVHT